MDTQVLIWGVRKKASSTQQDMVPRTEQLLDFLDSQKTSIIIPMPCVAEYLCGVDEAQYGAVMQIFRERFIIQPFDALAAVATARSSELSRST
jgi:hypothetical protein